MAPPRQLRFTISDRIGDREVSPSAVPLGLLKQFSDEVAKFLAGSRRELDAKSALISIISGSLVLEASGLPEDLELWSDISRLEAPESLHLVDPARALVIEAWQRRARNRPDRTYGIGDATGHSIVLVSARSLYRHGGASPWFVTERYLRGKVVEVGGQSASNLHLRLSDGRVLTIDSTEQQLRDEQKNHIYHDVMLRVRVEEHLHTGELRKARLIEFARYEPKIDEAQLDAFVRAGTDAWRAIDDPVEWVREQRGH